jgi:hypothetical protein
VGVCVPHVGFVFGCWAENRLQRALLARKKTQARPFYLACDGALPSLDPNDPADRVWPD